MWVMLAERVMSSWALSWAHFFTQYSATGAGELYHIDQSASSGPVRSGRIVVSSGSIPYTIGLSGYLRM